MAAFEVITDRVAPIYLRPGTREGFVDSWGVPLSVSALSKMIATSLRDNRLHTAEVDLAPPDDPSQFTVSDLTHYLLLIRSAVGSARADPARVKVTFDAGPLESQRSEAK